MDLGPRENEWREFVAKNLMCYKENERQWGSYELIFMCTPTATTTMQRFWRGGTFGWGFTPEEATAITVRSLMKAEPIDPNFENFMGKFLMADLRLILLKEKNDMTLPASGSQ